MTQQPRPAAKAIKPGKPQKPPSASTSKGHGQTQTAKPGLAPAK